MVKKKTNSKKSKREKSALTLLNIKVTGKDREVLASRARKYTDGNLSAWLRRAGLNYKPAA